METVMNLTEPVTIRLSTEKRFLYESEAASRNQSLRTYLRERLEQSESLPHQLSTNHSLSSSHDQGILLEILLLLRYTASPEKLNMVRKDLKRLNIPMWQGGSFSKE
jgi:hypothetical protein